MTLPALELEGTVSAGSGEGSRFVELDWVAAWFRRRLGFQPHPGTFNLRMEGPAWDEARPRLWSAAGAAIDPAEGFCAARCFAVLLEGRVPGAVVLPEVPGYPRDKLEVVSPVPVREALGVADGARVRIRIDLRQ